MPSDDSRSYSFDECIFPPVLELGFVKLSNADQLPAKKSMIRIEPDEIFIPFDTDEVLFALYMFRRPGGDAEFQRVCKWFDERKQRIRLPEGIKFEPEHQAVIDAPIAWQHEAWANSKSHLFHTYQSHDRAMVARWMGTKIAMITYPLFAMLHDNLRIHEHEWVTEFPETKVRPGVVRPFTTVPTTEALKAEIRNASLRARLRLDLPSDAPPETIQQAIHRHVDEVRAQANRSDNETGDLAVELGSLWGEALCAATHWEWRSLVEKGDSIATIVCHQGQSHMSNPLRNVHELLKSKPGAKPNNCSLLFDMIRVGSLPPASPGALFNLR